jgi:hypothetical protein
MTSKFLIPLKLLNITATPANPTAGFVSLYMKNNYLTSLSSSGVVLDVVLDRPLTGFVAIAPAPIIASDTVLIAFEKLQSQINTITSGGAGQPDEYYQDLIFNAITAGTGISVSYNDLANTFAISSTITQGPTGSGTQDYLARWTPNANTLGTSIIQDNGATAGIGGIFANTRLNVLASPTTPIAGWFTATGSTTYEQGLIGVALSSGTFNIGVEGRATNPNAGTNIGGWFRALGGGANYALQLQDGTEAAGKFLKAINGNGLANWATLTTADISGYTAYTLPTATASDLGGIKVGAGLTITAGVLSVTPASSYDEVINFNQLTPTTAGVVFDPATPATVGLLYVSTIDSSTWIWNGTTYVTEPIVASAGTAWFLSSAPTIDAGATKTADILRSGTVNIQGTYAGNPGVTSLRPGNVYINGDGPNTGRLHIRRKIDDATQNGAPSLYFERMRGTGGSTVYPLAGDSYGLIGFSSAGCIEVVGIENYGASTRGSDMIFRVGVIGAGSEVERLRILQNGKIRVNNKYNLPNVDGTSTQVLATDGSGNLTWTTIAGGTTLAGAGTNNYLTKWTPNGSTLGNSMLQDNGTSMAVNTPLTSTYGFYFKYSSGQSSIFGENTYAGAGDSAGVVGTAGGIVTGTNYGGLFVATNNVALNIGVKGGATGVTVGTNVGGYFHAANGASNYAIQLLDSTSTVIGRFLKNTSIDGKAQWANITAADISGGISGTGAVNKLALWSGSNSLTSDTGLSYTVGVEPTILITGAVNKVQLGGYNSGVFSNGYAVWYLSSYSDSLYPLLSLTRTRGTMAAPTDTITGDNMGELRWLSSYGETANIKSIATQSHSTGNAGGSLGLYTTKNTTSVAVLRMTIGESGNIAIGDPVDTTVQLHVKAAAGINYAIRLVDGTQAAGRFLKSMDANGKANWETSFTIDTNKVAKFEGQVVSLLSTNNAPTGTTQSINWNNGNSQTMNLGSATGNVALTFTNPVAGATYFLRVVQGATPRQISFSTIVKFPGGTAPTLTATANAVDTIVIFYDGVSYFGNYSLNYI